MLANSQNASDFDNPQERKISTSQHLWVRIIHAPPNIQKEFASGLNSLLVEKISFAKLCKKIKKFTFSPAWDSCLLALDIWASDFFLL